MNRSGWANQQKTYIHLLWANTGRRREDKPSVMMIGIDAERERENQGDLCYRHTLSFLTE